MFYSFCLIFVAFFSFFHVLHENNLKKHISNSIWCAQHLNTSRNIRHKITSLTFLPEDGHSHGGGAGGGGGTEGYVSSLFNHNPEIPRLELTSAAPKKEDVFSLRTFSDTGVHPYLSKALLEQGMETLTLVQSKAIPVVLSGKDALIKSQTGSGKTLAYAVPIIHRLQV